MSNNGQNNGLTMVFAFFTGFMAGAVISLLYAPSSRQGDSPEDSRHFD